MTTKMAAIAEALYRQSRVNQGRHGYNVPVEIIADRKHADKFHAMLKRWALSAYRFPIPVEWSEYEIAILIGKCREYKARSFPLLGVLHGTDLRVLIPDGYDYIFAIPDFTAMTYFDVTTMKTRKFAKASIDRVKKYERKKC